MMKKAADIAEAVAATPDGADGKLAAVYSAAAAREQEHRANSFLLATGGIAGGGVRTDYTGAVWETALGVPLQAPASRGEWFAPRFLNQSGHAIYTAGIATDERMRPLAEDRRVIYVALADKGSETLAALDKPLADLHHQLLGHLSQAELGELTRLLEKVRGPLAAEE